MYKLTFFFLLFSLSCFATSVAVHELDLSSSKAKTLPFAAFTPLKQPSQVMLGGEGSISGTLYEKGSLDLVSDEALININLFGRVAETGEWQYISTVNANQSDYVFPDLADGQFTINTSVNFDLDQSERPLYLSTFFDSNFTGDKSITDINNASIINIVDGKVLEDINFNLIPAAILVVTDESNGGEALSDLVLLNSENEFLLGALLETTVMTRNVATSTRTLFGYFPVGDYSFYIRSESQFYNTQSYVDEIYGLGACYACELDLLEGKGEQISLGKFEKKVINMPRSTGASLSGKLMFEDSINDSQGRPFVFLRETHGNGGYAMAISDNLSPNGEYSLSGIAAGEYILYYNRRGFIRKLHGGFDCPYFACEYFESYPIRINATDNLENMDIYLKKGAGFYGQLIDSDTQDALIVDENMRQYSAVVEFLDEDLNVAGGATLTFTEQANYKSVYGIPDGNYYIKTGSTNINNSNRNYVNQVYPDIECEGHICDFSQAQLVHVSSTENNVEINFNLNKAKFISGRIVDSINNQGIEKILVVVLNQQGLFVDVTRTDTDGFYNIGGLKSGQYFVRTYNGNKKLFKRDTQEIDVAASWENRIYPNVECSNNNCPLNTDNLISVEDTNIENINLTLTKGYSISGKIFNSSRNIGVQDVEIKLFTAAGEYIESYFSDQYGYYKTAAMQSGNYKIITENERHYVNQSYGGDNCGLGSCNPMNATSIVVGNDDVQDINFSLIPGSDYFPLLSGLWYNSEQSGHGLQLEVINTNGTAILFVSWYAMLDGKPIWLTGTGPLNKELAYVDLIITNGAEFPPSFNSGDVQKISWGLLKFKFTDLNNATISWDTKLEGYSSGSLDIQRLTHLSQKINEDNSIDACMSGTYYNPEQNGHGVMVEVLGDDADSLVITWFVYDNSQQFWLLATGSIQGTSVNMSAMYTSGTSFPPNFDSSQLQKNDWGELKIDKIDNNNIHFSWFPNDDNLDFGNGSMNMQRLTHINGLECQ